MAKTTITAKARANPALTTNGVRRHFNNLRALSYFRRIRTVKQRVTSDLIQATSHMTRAYQTMDVWNDVGYQLQHGHPEAHALLGNTGSYTFLTASIPMMKANLSNLNALRDAEMKQLSVYDNAIEVLERRVRLFHEDSGITRMSQHDETTFTRDLEDTARTEIGNDDLPIEPDQALALFSAMRERARTLRENIAANRSGSSLTQLMEAAKAVEGVAVPASTATTPEAPLPPAEVPAPAEDPVPAVPAEAAAASSAPPCSCPELPKPFVLQEPVARHFKHPPASSATYTYNMGDAGVVRSKIPLQYLDVKRALRVGTAAYASNGKDDSDISHAFGYVTGTIEIL
jgi:hypothetical protein